jgi:hypothetical protein
LFVGYLSLLPWTRIYKPPRLASSKAGNRSPTLHFLSCLRAFVLAAPLGSKPRYHAIVDLSGLMRSLTMVLRQSRLNSLTLITVSFCAFSISRIAAVFPFSFVPDSLLAKLHP